MRHSSRWMVLVLVAGGLGLAGCTEPAASGKSDKPAVVEKLGSGVGRVTLTQDAAKRLDIQTAAVSDTEVAGKAMRSVPYAAVLYDAKGQAWTFTNPQPLVFERQRISVDHVKGDVAMLTEGPPAGTKVVTVGAAELYGAELGVGK